MELKNENKKEPKTIEQENESFDRKERLLTPSWFDEEKKVAINDLNAQIKNRNKK